MKRAVKRETVVVYRPSARAKVVSLPLSDLLGNLPLSARVVPKTDIAKYIGAILGMLLGIGAFCLPLLFVFPVVAALILGVPWGLFVGGVGGWLLGPRFGPKPFWVLKRVVSGKGFQTVPYVATSLLVEFWAGQDGHSEDGKAKRTEGSIYTSGFAYDALRMDDEKDLHRAPRGVWEKLQFGALVILIIGIGALLFLMTIALTGE